MSGCIHEAPLRCDRCRRRDEDDAARAAERAAIVAWLRGRTRELRGTDRACLAEACADIEAGAHLDGGRGPR